MKYKKFSLMNECASLARSLNVQCRCSRFGISILGKTPKFFSLDLLYFDKGESCREYIYEVAEPSLQTKFL